jgi:hypothetical protein
VGDDGIDKMEGTEALDLATQRLVRRRVLRGGVSKVMRALSILKLSRNREKSLHLSSFSVDRFPSLLHPKVQVSDYNESDVANRKGSASSIQALKAHKNSKQRDSLNAMSILDDMSISSLDYSMDLGSSLSKEALYRLRKDARQKMMSSFLDCNEICSDEDLSQSNQSTPRMSRRIPKRNETHHDRSRRRKIFSK